MNQLCCISDILRGYMCFQEFCETRFTKDEKRLHLVHAPSGNIIKPPVGILTVAVKNSLTKEKKIWL